MFSLGVLLTPIIKREQTSLKALQGRSFAVDASIELHRFLALVRKPDGTLFTDQSGRVTSHLIGLLTWTTRLVGEYGIKLVFVFDGKPNPLKMRTLQARRSARSKAEQEYSSAVKQGDYTQAWSKAVMTGRVTREVLDDAKRLLGLMGIPWLEALEDAEAQASHMNSKGDVWAVGSKDYDCLLYGAPLLARYLTIAGQEYLPTQHRMRRLVPELVKLSENLAALEISREQLVDLAILVGTDFNEGVKGVGPKTALKLVRTHGSLEFLPEEIRSRLPADISEVRKIFLHPNILEKYDLKPTRSDPQGLKSFLVGERSFSERKVTPMVERLVNAKGQPESNLTRWLK